MMNDNRFYVKKPARSLVYVSDAIDCEFIVSKDKNPDDVIISAISSIEKAGVGDLAFLANEKYLAQLEHSKASVCIAKADFSHINPNISFIISSNPYYSYSKAIKLFYEPILSKQSSSLAIHPSAKIGTNVVIGYGTVIKEEAEIGDNSVIGSNCVIGHGVVIGKNARIDHSVTIEYSIIGDDVVILSGVRIGGDGFGFATHMGRHYKIFHIGRVMVGSDVEIGANSTIDRGSLQDTIIKDGVRIDNLVQVAHNVEIGASSILVSQAGIAGSSKIGNYCVLGGQVGVAGHLSIADGVQIAGQGGVIQNIKSPGTILGGTPTVPIRDWHRQSIILKKLVKNKE